MNNMNNEEEKRKKRAQKKNKYKKAHKERYLWMNKMILRDGENDPLNELDAMIKQQQDSLRRTKQNAIAEGSTSQQLQKSDMLFVSCVPQSRKQYYVERFESRKNERAYVSLETNMGLLNLELFCGLKPITCDNFIQLALGGYYNQSEFHRLIKGFMIQGGRRAHGGARGDRSIWGKDFEDEILVDAPLGHNERGVLSMANSGPNTNGSEFFVTFDACSHLDGKHTVFGRLVGGFDTLDVLENVRTSAADKPLEKLFIKQVVVYHNPFGTML